MTKQGPRAGGEALFAKYGRSYMAALGQRTRRGNFKARLAARPPLRLAAHLPEEEVMAMHAPAKDGHPFGRRSPRA